MDIGPGTDAALLERALEGELVDDAPILALVSMADAVRALDQSGLAPRPDYVAAVRERLLDERTEIAVGGETGTSEGGAPARVVRLPHRPLRMAAAVAASIVLIAALLGVASRSAVPGDALYPIKQLLDRAAVGLSGPRLDEGRTHLAQAQQHISEARTLLERGDVAPADLDVALNAAADSVVAADTILREVYASDHRPEALTELSDFLTRARAQVDAMDALIPDRSRPAYERLRRLVSEAEVRALREVAECGPCGDAASRARAALATLGAGLTSAPGAAAPGVTAPGATAPGTPLPGVSVAGPGVAITSGGATVGGGGATLPGAILNLPGAEVTTSRVVVGGGGPTLPGATASLPSVTLSAPTSSTLPLATSVLP